MRILIVNGYRKGIEGLKKFQEFQNAIMKILSEQKELVDTETEYFLRDRDNLDDFLYEIETSNLKREAGNNFDQLDMIFVTGDANVRPWSTSMKKILTLLRMSLRVKKNLYACSWGMQAIVYLCASDIEKEISIINGNGDGGKISEIHQFFENWQNFRQNDYFLDNTTGDLYGFNPQQNEWVPKSQVGLHYRRGALEYQMVGKYLVKSSITQTNSSHSNLYRSRQYEDTCKIRKIYLQHWAFQDCRSEFIVALKNSWDVHNVIFPNESKTYKILAESEQRGPLIIELDNILCTMFTVNPKYEMTEIPLRNFILMTLKNIKSSTQNNQANTLVSITDIHNLMKKSQFSLQYNASSNVKSQESKIRKAQQILNERVRNLGFSQSLKQNKSPLSNDSQNFFKTSVRYTNQSQGQTQTPILTQNLNDSFHKNINLSPIKQMNFMTENDQHNSKTVEISKFRVNVRVPTASTQNNNRTNNTNSKSKPFTKQGARDLMNQTPNQLDNYQSMTIGEIRGFLHPKLQSEYIQKNPLWVPGMFNENVKRNHRKIIRQVQNNDSFQSGKRVHSDPSLIHGTHHRMNTQTSQKFTETNFSSIFKDDPYQTQEEIMKKLQDEEDKKIIAGKTFIVTKGKDNQFTYIAPETAYPLNFSKHQFRKDNKESWIGAQFKFY